MDECWRPALVIFVGWFLFCFFFNNQWYTFWTERHWLGLKKREMSCALDCLILENTDELDPSLLCHFSVQPTAIWFLHHHHPNGSEIVPAKGHPPVTTNWQISGLVSNFRTNTLLTFNITNHILPSSFLLLWCFSLVSPDILAPSFQPPLVFLSLNVTANGRVSPCPSSLTLHTLPSHLNYSHDCNYHLEDKRPQIY